MHGSISGRELSFVPDVAHACAVGYHSARFVAGIRADALRQLGSAAQCEVQIQADGGRAEPNHWKSRLIPLMHGIELVCVRCGIPAVVVSFLAD